MCVFRVINYSFAMLVALKTCICSTCERLQQKIDWLLDMFPVVAISGYPEPRIKGFDTPEFHGLWMDEYFSDYIRRDIQRLLPRINPHNFRLFIQTLSFHSGKIINQSDIARALEVSSVTSKEYLEIIHNTFIWRNLRSDEKNKLKKVQKMPKGFFRDQRILHHLLKINSLDNLLIHPAAGFSFGSFVVEEIIRGFQCTLTAGIDFYFYRTATNLKRDTFLIEFAVFGGFASLNPPYKLTLAA